MPDMRSFFATFLLFFTLAGLLQAQMPSNCRQAIIGVADSWDSTSVKLSMVERDAQGAWVQVLGPYAARLGRAGLVWGLGLHPNIAGATIKAEGDGRSPAGIFNIGMLYLSMNQQVYNKHGLKTHQVSPYDLWVSDISKPTLYNRHVRINHPARSTWERKEMMRQDDYAHSLKLQICHNSNDVKGRPILGAGSSIFFHLWRNNGQSVTAGCTSMAEDVMRCFLARLDPKRNPVYILLPRSVYLQYRKAWMLP